jgi:hypothetical protein
LFFLIAAVPVSIFIAGGIIFLGHLWSWQAVVKDEAREKGISFEQFIATSEYRAFLHAKARDLIRRTWK